MVISEKYKIYSTELQINTLIAILPEDRITEMLVMDDEFCRVFDVMIRRRGLSGPRRNGKGNYHRNCRMLQPEINCHNYNVLPLQPQMYQAIIPL